MKRISHYYSKSYGGLTMLILLVLLFSQSKVFSQTTLNTTAVTGFSNNNGSGTATFNFQNTNPYAVIITDIEGIVGTAGITSADIWIKTTPVNGAPGAISVANGWTQVATGTFTGVANTSTLVTQPMLTGISVSIPAGVTYGMAVAAYSGSSGRQRYHTMISPNIPLTTVSGGGCNIFMGTNISYAGGAPPTAPTNNPRGWLGKLTFVPAVVCTAPPVPGSAIANPSSGLCTGSNIELNLTGNSGGTGMTFQWQSSSSSGGPWTNVGTSQPTSVLNTPATSTLYYRCQLTCSGNTQSSVPVLVTVNPPFPAGTYTINSAVATGGSNFQTFNAAITALSCGIAGPVVLNVVAASGPYTEQVVIPAIGGTSVVNTITINGNNNVITFPAGTNYSTVRMEGADFITWNAMNFATTGTTSAIAFSISNQSDNNNFNNCTFTVPQSVTSSLSSALAFSSSQTSATTAGNNGNNNIFSGCTMSGGYYCVSVNGQSGGNITGNQFLNCTIEEYYIYGLYHNNGTGTIISGCTVQRPTRSIVTTGYGIILNSGSLSCLVEKNIVRNLFGGATTSTSTAYPLYGVSGALGQENNFINNVVHNIDNNGLIYGIYLSGVNYVNVYHNTFSLDYTASTAGTTYGIYATGTAGVDVRNNIVSVTRGGSGTKYCLYYSTNTGKISNYNDLYMNSAAGTNYIGFNSTSHATLALWQGTGFDANSVSVDPGFLLPGVDYTPNVGLVNNIGTPLGVLTDINNNARSLSAPDPGAYEFSLGGLDAGISWVSPASPTLAGSKIITVNINNLQAQTITSINLSYTDGTVTQTQNFTGLNITSGSNQNLSFTVPYLLVANVTMTATINSVNGGNDAIAANNTFNYDLCIGLNGIYTINSAIATGGVNFQSFTAAVNALNCGILGPVVFNVASGSGPYTEQVIIDEIPGSSAINTITFNGNSNTLQFATADANNRHVIRLNGADYITMNNLNIVANTGTYGWGIHFTNQANNNTISNCTITVNSSVTTAYNFLGICFSNSVTTPISAGNNGNNNTITGCIITGGYYTIIAYGNTVAPFMTNNTISNNIIQDSYSYCVYLQGNVGGVVSNNNISRPTRNTTTTTAGVFVTTGNSNMLIEKNRIHNMFDAMVTNTSTIYGIYVSADGALGSENRIINNLVYDINHNGIAYGIYNTGGAYMKVFHNTISLDNTSATAGTTYGLYQITSETGIEYRNNIVSITRGGTGIKYGIYFSTSGSSNGSNNNNVYVSSAGTGAQYYGYYGGTNYATLANWQTANGGIYDANSNNVNPNFFNPAAGNYKPLSAFIDNNGAPLGIATDITGALRSPGAPDPGAYEFTVYPKDAGVISVISPNAGGCYSNAETIIVTIKNYGSTTLDFSVDPLTVFCNITGPVNVTVSGSPSGLLAVGATTNVILTPTVNGTANGVYTFNAYTVMTSDGEIANDAFPQFTITVGPVAGVVSASVSSFCNSGSPVLNATGVYGGAIQWQSATAGSGGPWTDVGSGGSIYNSPVISQTTYYRAKTVCNGNEANSNVVTVEVSTPMLTSIAPASRCGLGTVTLGAAAAGSGSPLWYAASTGGLPLASGSTYTTPVINSTTNYWVSSSEGGASGLTVPGDGNWNHFTSSGSFQTTTITGAYMILNVLQPLTLSSMDIYPSAALGTAFSIEARTGSASGPAYTSWSGNTTIVNSGTPSVAQTLNVNWVLPAGTYYIGFIINPNTWRSGLATHTFPWTLPGYASMDYNLSPSYQYYFYNLSLSTGCESARTMITATVTPPPSMNVSTADAAVCPGGSTTLSVSSSNDPGYSYSWTSSPAGFTASGAGPHTISPTVTTKYYVLATDNSAGPNAGCVALDSVNVITGLTLAAGTVNASQTTYCVTGSPTLGLSGSDGGVIQWQQSSVSSSGPWTNVGNGSTNHTPVSALTQTTYFRATVSCQSTTVTSNVVTIEVVSPQVLSTTGDTRCGPGSVTLQASAPVGTSLNWYTAPSGGAPVATGPVYSPTVFNTGNYYVSAVVGTGGTATAAMPAQLSTFSSNVRGYWFTAPADFTITGLTVPSTGTTQSIAVVKFTGNVPPPVFSATTNSFTTLFLTQNNNSLGVIPCNITISAGDVIGILGQRGTVTSYGPATNPTFITIAGQSVGLTRMGMQFPLTTTAPQQIWQEVSPSSSIGRIEFTYTTGCESPRSAVPVLINPEPAVTLSTDLTLVCSGQAANLTATSTNPNYTYTWNPGGMTGSSVAVSPSANTIYTLTAFDNSGGAFDQCQAIENITINGSNDLPPVPSSFSNAPVCEASDILLFAYDGVNYSWSGPNSFTQTSAIGDVLIPAAQLFNSGNYTVTVTGATGCQTSETITVTVNDNPEPFLDLMTEVSCDGFNDGTFQVGVNGGTPFFSFTENSLGQNFSGYYDNLVDGTYYVSVSDLNQCSSLSPVEVIVTTVPNIAPVIVCPANMTVANDPGLCGKIVSYATPVGTDVCPVVGTLQTNGLANGVSFPIGTTNNTFVVTDVLGLTASCSFSVTVTDSELPTIVNCPSDFSSCNPISWTPPSISDNCLGLQVVASHTPGTNFPSGTTIVTYTATDAYNNVSVCSFNVTRLEESVAPTSISSNRDFNNICSGDNVTLTINGGSLGEAASWKWYTGTCGGTALPAFNGMSSITVSPTVNTTYYVRAEGQCNTTACVSIAIVVSTAAPSGTTITSMPAFGAVGVTGVITVTPVPGATFYRWTSNLGHINSIWFNGAPGPVETAIPSVNVSFQIAQQNYQIRVIVGNACGRSNTASGHIRGTVPATTCLNGPVLACPNTTATYSVAACQIPGSNGYQWTIPSGAATITSGQGTQTITVAFAAGFTSAQICVNGVSNFGLAGPTTCLTVSNSTAAPGAISGNAAPCESGLENYTIGAVTGATSYLWTTNIAGATVSGTSTTGAVQFPAGPFSGNVCVQAVSSCGTSVATCYAVSSGSAGNPGVISGPVSGICGASNVNYALATNNANSYNWILPAGVTVVSGGSSNSVNVNFATGLTGPIVLTVEAFYNCGSATSSITVDGAPATPTVTPNTICAGTDELYFASSAGADTYSWTTTGADYEECTNGDCSQYYVIWNVGGGSLSVTASNTCGTSAPFAFSTNCRIVSGGEQLETKVYPNPTNGNLTVEFTSYAGGNYDLTITDMSGRTILNDAIKASSGMNQHQVNLESANAGMYFLYLKDATGVISVHKITKE